MINSCKIAINVERQEIQWVMLCEMSPSDTESDEKHWSSVYHLVWRGTDHVLKYLLNTSSSKSFKMSSIQLTFISSVRKENEVQLSMIMGLNSCANSRLLIWKQMLTSDIPGNR